MQLVVIANILMQKEFENKGLPEGIEVHFVSNIAEATKGANAYFYLLDEENLLSDLPKLEALSKPIFANAVVTVLDKLPANFIRVNAWRGFFERSILELSFAKQNEALVQEILLRLKWQYQNIDDIPGFITARTIAMIINEAYFALGDDVSTKADIDTAMKLGTNYPYGPFEWSEKIGLRNIEQLLTTLSIADKGYTPAPALLNEINNWQ